MDNQTFLYHVTLERSVKRIKRKGLIPMIGPRSALCGEAIPAVYLFASYEDVGDAMQNWLGEQFPPDEKLALLKISFSQKELQALEQEGFEYRARTAIKPKRICGWYDEHDQPLFSERKSLICLAYSLIWHIGYRLKRIHVRIPNMSCIVYRTRIVRETFFGSTRIGKALLERASSLCQHHPESEICKRLLSFCLPF